MLEITVNLKIMGSQELHHRLVFLLLLSGFLISSTNTIDAQTSHTLRSFQSVPQSMAFELGKLPNYRVFVGAPYISSINGTLRGSGMKLSDIGIASGQDFLAQDFNAIVNGVEEQSQLDLGLKMDLLYFGIRFGRMMFHMHIGERIALQSNFSKSMFQMISDVSQSSNDLYNSSYDLSNLRINGLHYRFLGAGLTGAINDYVSVGFRVKYLKGLKMIRSNNHNLGLSSSINSNRFNINGGLDILSTGMDYLADVDERNVFDYFKGSSFGSHGVALDVGINVQFTDKLEVFGSLLDLGKISWTKNIDKFTINNQQTTIRNSSLEEFEEDMDVVFDDLYAGESNFDTTFSSSLVAHAYGGARYQLNQDMSLSLLANARFLPEGIKVYSSVGFSAVLNNYLEVVGNANYGEGAFSIGAGFSTYAGPVQFYLATDNLPAVFSIGQSKYVQATGGINVVLDRPKRKKKKKKKKYQRPTKPLEPGKYSKSDRSKNKEEPEAVLAADKVRPTKETNTYREPDVAAPIVKENSNKKKATNRIDFGPDPKAAEEVVKPAEEVEEEPELDRLVVLEGKTVDKSTNEHLTGISIEFYKLNPDGSREIKLLQAFYNGNIQLHPDRNYPHVLYIKKTGYKTLQYNLTPKQMQGKTSLRLRFPLVKR